MDENFFSDAELKQLKEITELYAFLKDLILYSEELNDLASFMPPINEIKDAYDHFMRITSVKFGLREGNDEYVKINLSKIYSHIYRATFELFDYIRIYQKDSIDKKICTISNEALVNVFPEYYREIKPKLEDLINQIPIYKKEKDIGNPNLETVKKYHQSIQEVGKYIDRINAILPSLIEYDIRREAEQKRINRVNFFYLVISAIIGVVAGAVIVHFLI